MGRESYPLSEHHSVRCMYCLYISINYVCSYLYISGEFQVGLQYLRGAKDFTTFGRRDSHYLVAAIYPSGGICICVRYRSFPSLTDRAESNPLPSQPGSGDAQNFFNKTSETKIHARKTIETFLNWRTKEQ